MANLNFRVGLVQMSCGPDPAQNLRKALDLIGAAAARGAQVVCLPELFQTQYFCQREDAALFDLAEPIPGPASQALGEAARRHGVVVVGSLFERRAPGVYHNTRGAVRRRRHPVRHLPQDAHPRRPALLREVLLHPGRSGLPRARHPGGPDRHPGLLGPVVSRRPPGSPPWPAPSSCSTPPPSAGTPRSGSNSARSSTTPGRPSSAATPSPTGSTSPR